MVKRLTFTDKEMETIVKFQKFAEEALGIELTPENAILWILKATLKENAPSIKVV